MKDRSIDDLVEELESYRRQRKTIDALISEVGGKGAAKRTAVFNVLFVSALVVLFGLDLLRHFIDFAPIPETLSLQIGILLVSVKILWIAHKRTEVEHFQFWIMNTMENRINQIYEEVKRQKKAAGDSAAM